MTRPFDRPCVGGNGIEWIRVRGDGGDKGFDMREEEGSVVRIRLVDEVVANDSDGAEEVDVELDVDVFSRRGFGRRCGTEISLVSAEVIACSSIV